MKNYDNSFSYCEASICREGNFFQFWDKKYKLFSNKALEKGNNNALPLG